MSQIIDASPEIQASGTGYVVRPCDRPLYDDLKAKMIPDDEIAGIMAHRQSTDRAEGDAPADNAPTSD